MKSALALSLFWLLAGVGSAASAQSSGGVRIAGEPPAKIAAPVAARREEVRREEAFAGRRLTAEERAELREQLRRQWAAQVEISQTAQATHAAQPAESQPAERIVPGPASARSQRH